MSFSDSNFRRHVFNPQSGMKQHAVLLVTCKMLSKCLLEQLSLYCHAVESLDMRRLLSARRSFCLRMTWESRFGDKRIYMSQALTDSAMFVMGQRIVFFHFVRFSFFDFF